MAAHPSLPRRGQDEGRPAAKLERPVVIAAKVAVGLGLNTAEAFDLQLFAESIQRALDAHHHRNFRRAEGAKGGRHG